MTNTIKKTALTLAIGSSLALSAAAQAQDWSGLYAGAGIGLGNYETTTDGSAYGENSFSETKPVAAFDVGYNWQNGAAVTGVELDLYVGDLSNQIESYDSTYYVSDVEWNWAGSVRGRMGAAIDNVLVYATGGLAFADAEYDFCYFDTCPANGGNFNESEIQLGVVYGAGVEVAMSEGMTMRGEFLSTQLATLDASRDNGDPANMRSGFDAFRFMINWSF